MSSTEEPIDRLNYFNGQRLLAEDLRLEQAYHIQVRRWLNRTLYTPGIAGGLEVQVSPTSPRKVVVSAGVALDPLGREVILVEDTEVEVVGVPSTEADWVFGNYLAIEYAEETVGAVQDGCSVGQGRSGSCDLAWGGPTRIRATPVLSFQSTWPAEATGRILLAQVELGPGCEVVRIHSGVRKYVDAADSTVRSYALEGEKDIDEQNPKLLTFHVRGGPPSSVLLYLRAARFSSLHYTELPAHVHAIDLRTEPKEGTDDHHHDVVIGDRETAADGSHAHDLRVAYFKDADGDKAVKLATSSDGSDLTALINAKAIEGGSAHSHTLALGTIPTSDAGGTGSHRHEVIGDTESVGVAEDGSGGPRGGSEHTYVNRLKIFLNGSEVTRQILSQLGGPPGGWDQLGDGTSAHPLVVSGTGAIDLLRLDQTLVEGEHTLELRVDNRSGGNVRYNLYVE
jgi:hypothetical protein